jgi:hypothetical protein
VAADEAKVCEHSLDHLVIFAGAGVSAASGLPLFDALRTELFADVLAWPWMTKRTRLQLESSLAQLAPEFAVSLLDKQGESPREYICERLSGALPAYEHRLLALAIARGARVYTSNFDQLIEEASNHEIQVAVRRRVDDPVGPGRLLKLHGSCPGIIVSAEEVLLSIQGPSADAFLDDCKKNAVELLVWGYKGADPDLAPLVRTGATKASKCTWIAFSDEDQREIESQIKDGFFPRIKCARSNGNIARGLVQQILDPGADLPLEHQMSNEREPVQGARYAIRRSSTRADALAQLGSARLGRWAWIGIALRGDKSAIRNVVRSYLYDSRCVQAIALSVLPTFTREGVSPGAWKAHLTAAQGRGIRASDDHILDRFLSIDNEFDLNGDGVEIRSRVATMLRVRGRLADALGVLTSLATYAEESSTPSYSAMTTGHLLYELSIVHRLRGDFTQTQEVLRSIDTQNPAIVGANWASWLEDEHCAVAIGLGDVDAAEYHLSRAHRLADAYGRHRLARIDLAIRALQLDVLRGIDFADAHVAVRATVRLARRSRLLTPLRRAWFRGILADAARRTGEVEIATIQYRALLRSPHLLHQLAALAGMALTEVQNPPADVGLLMSAIGFTATELLLSDLSIRSASAEREFGQWVVDIRNGGGFLFLS